MHNRCTCNESQPKFLIISTGMQRWNNDTIILFGWYIFSKSRKSMLTPEKIDEEDFCIDSLERYNRNIDFEKVFINVLH